jgi:hypothetical protein
MEAWATVDKLIDKKANSFKYVRACCDRHYRSKYGVWPIVQADQPIHVTHVG